MEEQEKLQKELNVVSAQAESAKDAEDRMYYRETVLLLKMELLLREKLGMWPWRVLLRSEPGY